MCPIPASRYQRPDTSVHCPGTILEELAVESGIGRTRLIVDACQKTVARRRGWPEEFFDPDRFSEKDLKTLRSGWTEFDESVVAARRSRKAAPF